MYKPSQHTLETIWGHEPLKQLVRSMITRQRLPHAMLLHGPDGVGKRSLAFAIAKQIFSSGRPPSEQSLSSAAADFRVFYKPDDMFGDGGMDDLFGEAYEAEEEQEVEAPEEDLTASFLDASPEEKPEVKTPPKEFEPIATTPPKNDSDFQPHLHLHPRVLDQVERSYPLEYQDDVVALCKYIDLNIIEPVGRSSSIKVDQVRVLQEAAYMPPMEGRYRVILVFGADAITGSAANSLLKFLEEPPSYLILILVTDHYHKVLDTIRSRCASLLCQPSKREELVSRLIEEERVEPGLAEVAASFSEGKVGIALNSLSGQALKKRQEIFESRLSIDRSGPSALPSAVHRCMESTETLSDAALILLSLVRDRMVQQLLPKSEHLLVNHDMVDHLTAVQKDLDSLMTEAARLGELFEMAEHPAIPASQVPLELALWPNY